MFGVNSPADFAVRIVVIPDRADAEAAAEELADATWCVTPPRVVREALAGEDDAEDAQWLLLTQSPPSGWSAAQLEELNAVAADHDGWVDVEP